MKGISEDVEVLFEIMLSNVSLNRKVSDAQKSISQENANAYWQFNSDDIIKSEFGQQLALVLKWTRRKKVALICYSNGGSSHLLTSQMRGNLWKNMWTQCLPLRLPFMLTDSIGHLS